VSAARRMATWPGDRKSAKKSAPPPLSDLFTWDAIALMVSARSLSVIPVYVSLWLTQRENEDLFFRS